MPTSTTTDPYREPNMPSCHFPNLLQICWKNQLLVSNMSAHLSGSDGQQAAFRNVSYLKLPQKFIDIQILVKMYAVTSMCLIAALYL
jgi:hypothetical protein